MIFKHKSTKLNSSKFTNNSIKHLFTHRSKSSISNNAILHVSKLDGCKYCYVSLTIQLNISHFFIHILMIKQF